MAVHALDFWEYCRRFVISNIGAKGRAGKRLPGVQEKTRGDTKARRHVHPWTGWKAEYGLAWVRMLSMVIVEISVPAVEGRPRSIDTSIQFDEPEHSPLAGGKDAGPCAA
jgi:hypothetical protein